MLLTKQRKTISHIIIPAVLATMFLLVVMTYIMKPHNAVAQPDFSSLDQQEKAMHDAGMSIYKKTLDKCTPFTAHMNDNVTFPPSFVSDKEFTKNCRKAMEDIAYPPCGQPTSMVKTSEWYIICSDPRYQNWFDHYWKTRNSIVFQILSNTIWSGTLSDSSGSSSVAGQNNKNITLLSCSGISLTVSKKDNDESKHLTLNVIQNTTQLVPTIASSHTTNAPYGMVSATGC